MDIWQSKDPRNRNWVAYSIDVAAQLHAAYARGDKKCEVLIASVGTAPQKCYKTTYARAARQLVGVAR